MLGLQAGVNRHAPLFAKSLSGLRGVPCQEGGRGKAMVTAGQQPWVCPGTGCSGSLQGVVGGGLLGSLAQNQLITRPVPAFPFFSLPPTAWWRLGSVRTGSKCPFPMATLPCVVSDQRWPPAHFLAGKVLPTPEAMAFLAGSIRSSCQGDCLLGQGGTRGFSGTRGLQQDR